MKVKTAQNIGEWRALKPECLILFVFNDKELRKKLYKGMGSLLKEDLSKIPIVNDFKGDLGKTLSISFPGSNFSKGILLVGLGEKKNLKLDYIRRASGIACRGLNGNKINKALILVSPEQCSPLKHNEIGEAIAEGLMLSSFRYTYQTDAVQEQIVSEIILSFISGISGRDFKEFQKGVSDAIAVCREVNMARELVSAPANHMTPAIIANAAKSVTSSKKGVKCRVISTAEAKKIGMESFISVTKGSNEPAKFIILEYNPPKQAKAQKTITLVGKGITFDSGGISLKPSKDMHKMKYDMAGGAAVIGIIAAAASLKLPVRLIGIVPATENLPDGKATKPGDVVKSLSGKTIEIQNTDAEGRLVLADSLTYALRFKPYAIIDLATLTGACVVALGSHAMGMMGNDSSLMKLLTEAGNITHERVWELPLWDDYCEDIRSDIADMKNIGAGSAGSIIGGIFLKNFVNDVPWVHLDIAGTAWVEKKHDYLKGASGSGIRLLIKFFHLLTKANK